MKYGETLPQRSIPEWGPYNVDYNDLKRLIKLRTTEDQPRAVDICGQGRRDTGALQAFEDELYGELVEQFQRIDLFVQSKAGEIQRRLDHLDKQIARLNKRDFPAGRQRISVRRLEKFSKAEEDVLRAGEEVRSLSRFIGAQRLAFHKLLKKYAKWTQSSSLLKRFLKVLDQPASFSRRDLQPLVLQWTEVLAAVREPFKDGMAFKADYGERKPSLTPVQNPVDGTGHGSAVRNDGDIDGASGDEPEGRSHTICDRLFLATQTGSDVDLDTALATLPQVDLAGSAVYWIHPDNLVELQILLLQHTRLRLGPEQTSDGTRVKCPSPTATRPGSRDTVGDFSMGDFGDETSLAVIGDVKTPSEYQHDVSCAGLSSNSLRSESATARWCGDVDASIALTAHSDAPHTSNRPRVDTKTMKLRRKDLRAVFGVEKPFHPQRRQSGSTLSSEVDAPPEHSLEAVEDIRDWISRHQEARPLVQVCSRRTRFIGLGNNPARGVWAVLDKDIKMTKASVERLGSKTPLSQSSDSMPSNDDSLLPTEPCSFPHAVLVVRWEGGAGAGLARMLDRSHLTEKIEGFSVVDHAIALLCDSGRKQEPHWFPALAQDIRKLPISSKPARRRSTLAKTSSDSGNSHSQSATSNSVTDGASSGRLDTGATGSSNTSVLATPPLNALNKKRGKNQRHPLRREISDADARCRTKYWSEYDDGDERPGEEPYTIFVDPHATIGFPGRGFLLGCTAGMSRAAHHAVEVLKVWAGQDKVDEHRPFVEGYFSQQPNSGQYDVEGAASPSDRLLGAHRSYGTFPDDDRGGSALRWTRLYYAAYIMCFIASMVLFVVMAFLATSPRHGLGFPGSVGVIVGVIASLGCAVVGITMMLFNREPLGWAHRIAALSTFGVICLSNGVLLAHVGTGG